MMLRIRMFLLAAILFGAASLSVAQEGSTTVGGYGEVHMVWNNPHIIANGKDTALAGSSSFNVPRFVLFVAHNFNDWIAMRSELEIEDTKLESESGTPGEVALEQLYLDFVLNKSFGVRAGLLLVPVGIINEMHEPPTFNGVARPNFDHDIIPSTWREIGAGVYGTPCEGLNYRAYIMAGMKAEGFSHDEGIREGRQEGQKSSTKNLALTGRIEYSAVKGLKLGGAFFFGGTSAGNPAFGTDGDGVFAIPMTVFGVDAQYNVGDLALRGVFASVGVDADKINKALHTDSAGTITNGIAKGMGGFYVEAAYNIMKMLHEKSEQQLSPFVRYENFNVNQSVASGMTEDKALIRTELTVGVTYKPRYDLAIKADWQSMGNKAFSNTIDGASAGSRFSLGVGYAF
jgi:hypothetical protein